MAGDTMACAAIDLLCFPQLDALEQMVPEA